MATLTAGAFKDALQTQLEARGGLSGVTIHDAETNTEDLKREHVVLGDWTGTDDYLTLGTTYDETYIVDGRVIVRAPDSAKAARDRAIAILKEVKDQLITDPTVNATVFEARFSGYSGTEDIWQDQGRTCECEFTIDVEAHHTG